MNKIKKLLGMFLAFALCLGTVIPAYAATSNSVEVTTAIVGAPEIETCAVSISKDFSAATGKSWSTSFTTDKWFSEDHNAFKTVITNFSGGSYKYIITGSNGYSYTSSEYSKNMTFTTTNAKSSVTYTIYIVNTSSGTISGTVKVSSYYAD